MRFSRLSGATLAVAALVAAMVASAAYGITTASGTLGEADFVSCVSGSGADTCTSVDVPLDEPTGFAFNDDQTRLLVASHSGDAVIVLKRDKNTGKLTPLDGSPCVSATDGRCLPGRQLDGARDIGTATNVAYVASDGSDSVVTLTRASGQSGRWEELSNAESCITQANPAPTNCISGRALTGASSVAVSGSNVYVGGNGSIAVFQRLKKGLKQLGGTDGCVKNGGADGCANTSSALGTVTDLVVSKNGKLLYAVDGNAVHVFTRDSSGRLEQQADVVAPNASSGPITIGFDRSKLGTAYVIAGGSNAVDVFSADKTTGELTQLPLPNGCINASGAGGCTSAPALGSIGSLVRAHEYKTTQFVYVAGSTGVVVFHRDKKTGILTQLATPAGCTTENGGGGCLSGKGLSGLTDIVSTGGGKHIYVAGTGFDSVVTFHQGG